MRACKLPTAPSRARFVSSVLRLVSKNMAAVPRLRLSPTLARRASGSEDHLAVDAETLRRWMLEERLWSRQRRCHARIANGVVRKEHFGELVQLDGSFHAWFEERGPRGCLMNMVDDAVTGTTVALPVQKEEHYLGCRRGAAFVDRAVRACPWRCTRIGRTSTKVAPTPKQELRGEEPLTQFGRMCAQLGIRILGAHSPGRPKAVWSVEMVCIKTAW